MAWACMERFYGESDAIEMIRMGRGRIELGLTNKKDYRVWA